MKIKIPIVKSLIAVFVLSSVSVIYFTGLAFSDETATGTLPLNFTVAQLISIIPSTNMTDGITFSSVNANTNGNPALHNSDGDSGGSTSYWTVDATTSSDAAFWNKLTAPITCTGGTCTYHVSGSNATATTDFSANSTFDNTKYTAIGNCTVVAVSSSCYGRYFLDVSTGVSSGDYGGATAYTYCANATTGNTACS